ncbi:MAG: glycosyltransferase family 4 protein [Candidatus Aenigmatarchaeota archaeon]
MRINFLIWYLNYTGGNRILVEIANRLVERGHEVTIITSGMDEKWFPIKAELKFIPTLGKHPSSTSLIATALSFLLKSLPKADIDVATWCFTAYPVMKNGKGIPVYYCQHYEVLFFENPMIKWLVKKTYDMNFNFITNSSWLRTMLFVNHNKDSELVLGAIDLEMFKPQKIEKNEKIKKVVSLCKPKIKWKGFWDLVEAWKIVTSERKDVELVLYGTKKENLKLPFKYSFIHFPSDKKLVNLYNEATAVVCPSWYESFPLPPLEAMACGTPVITTRYGTEDYAYDGKNCLVVHPRRPKEMAEAILRLLDDEKLQKKLSKNGIKTAKQFSWKKQLIGLKMYLRIF